MLLRSRFVVPALAAASLALAGPAAAAGKPKSVSWGKPGVAFAQYQADSLLCANRAYGVTVGLLPKTARGLAAMQNAGFYAFLTNQLFYRDGFTGLDALRALDPHRAVLRTSTYYEAFHHAAYYDVVEQLQTRVDACLSEHGYQRFRLTAGQRRDLDRLRQGTPERARYLHALGSDATVLEAQRAA
jgi:hypothetical protein